MVKLPRQLNPPKATTRASAPNNMATPIPTNMAIPQVIFP